MITKKNKKLWEVHSSSIIVGGILLLLFISACLVYWQQAKSSTSRAIAQDVVQLAEIFKNIDQSCTIIGFDHQKNYVDFLNVVKFEGSKVGSMNLAHPDKWSGPYVKDNPTVQEQPYQIVRTTQGYFIVPGDGVKLYNGKIVGKDIMLDEDADIAGMIKDPDLLLFKDKPLAAALPLSNSKSLNEALLEEDDAIIAMQTQETEKQEV